jgi:serine phosphatase RsbU (regulator of sigma subunit)
VEQLEHDLEATRLAHRRQLELAARIHRSLLPGSVRHAGIHVDVRYLPIEEVGGDYCQVRFSDPETCYVTMCDVTGHGIGPALLATRASSQVRQGIVYGRPPRDIVRSLNKFIYDDFVETGLYLTFIATRIDLERRTITWCGAGHPSPLLIRSRESRVDLLESQNPLIGVLDDLLQDDPEHTLELEPGDRLMFYTDGITETADAAGRQLGMGGLARIALEAAPLELFGVADHVLDVVGRYQHGPTTDDKTLIVAEIR